MSEQLELRKFCVGKAISAFSNCQDVKASEVLKLVDGLYEFTVRSGITTSNPENPTKKVLVKHLPSLTSAQKNVLRKAIEMAGNAEEVNGSAIARKMGQSQGNISCHLRTLVRHGYISRHGNTFFVKYKPNGEAYNPVVRKFPAAPAKGYNGTMEKALREANIESEACK